MLYAEWYLRCTQIVLDTALLDQQKTSFLSATGTDQTWTGRPSPSTAIVAPNKTVPWARCLDTHQPSFPLTRLRVPLQPRTVLLVLFRTDEAKRLYVTGSQQRHHRTGLFNVVHAVSSLRLRELSASRRRNDNHSRRSLYP